MRGNVRVDVTTLKATVEEPTMKGMSLLCLTRTGPNTLATITPTGLPGDQSEKIHQTNI